MNSYDAHPISMATCLLQNFSVNPEKKSGRKQLNIEAIVEKFIVGVTPFVEHIDRAPAAPNNIPANI